MMRFSCLRNFTDQVKQHRLSLIICLLLVPFTTYFGVNRNGFVSDELALSLADGFVAAGSGALFYCNSVLLPVFFLSLLTQRDFSVNYLLYNGTPKRVWRKEVYSALSISILFTLWQSLCVVIFVGPRCGSLINFEQRHSLFAYATNGRTLSGLHFWQLLLPLLLFLFCTGFLFMLLFLLLKWGFWTSALPFVLLIFAAFFDSTNRFGACTFFGVFYDKWLAYNPVSLLFPVVLIVFCIALGNILSVRKEFLHAK